MAAIQPGTKGRNFTADELTGRRVRIVGPVPTGKTAPIGMAMMIIADDEQIDNAMKVELAIDPCSVVEAKITLWRFDLGNGEMTPPTEEITLRDNVEVSFSAIVSEVK